MKEPKYCSRFWFKFNFLVAATVHFIPIFTSKFKENKINNNNLVNIIIVSMEDCLAEINNVEKIILSRITIKNSVKEPSLLANMYLSLLVIFPSLAIIIGVIFYE
ncbi:MAG: hypothetical protein P9L97_07635 [Candidatus Tenebribacter davisii]|jgi:hypothetical protein|nr:hypothetical protein [Candidatus Tenebribacter davisii]